MSVSNGQLANQTVFNNAFMSRLVDTSTVGRVDLSNVLAASGPTVTNLQREVNSLNSFSGRTSGSAFNATPSYTNNNVVADGDTLLAAIDKLDETFHGTTGHFHSGVNGEGAKVQRAYVTGPSNTVATGGNIDALSTATYGQIRLSGASVTLRGVDDGSDQRQVTIFNVSGSQITVKNNFGAPVSATDKIITGTGADLTLEDGAGIVLEYDATNSLWRVVGGPGGDEIVAYQEVPSGVVNGTNDTFGPLSFTPVNDDSILVFVDGVERDTSAYSITGGDTVVFGAGHIPASGQSVYVFYLYKQSGGVAPSVGLSVQPKLEYLVLNAGDITAKQKALANTPTTPSEIVVDAPDGVPLRYSIDFTVTGGNVVDWNGLALDGVLASGDVLRVLYFY